MLGSTPGSAAGALSNSSGGGAPISGRAGPTAPHVPSTVSNPLTASEPIQPPAGYAAPVPQPTFVSPSYGTYELPADGEDDGPPDGMTLDQAIERLLASNLDLRGKAFEIPQAEADILNAGLRANPVFYADAQLVPYGTYTRNRPGGQTQYDVNVSYPLDVSRKRPSRLLYASRLKEVIEAQYLDEVRRAIDQLYGAFVTVQSARQTVRYAESAVKGFERFAAVTEELYKRDQNTRADVANVKSKLYGAQVGLIDAREALKKAKRDLGTQLNLPPTQAEVLEIRGGFEDHSPPPPPEKELIDMALQFRPDLMAFRLGVRTAEANVRLQKANRFSDVYVLYQPYTYQDNSPFGLKSPTSWALGVTVPLPLYNRNQGGIVRSQLNVLQSSNELKMLERQIITEVQQALNEYQVTKRMVAEIRGKIVPAAYMVREDTARLYKGGEVNVLVFLEAQRNYQDTVKQYKDTVIRHRRSMLGLNTVVGRRIFP